MPLRNILMLHPLPLEQSPSKDVGEGSEENPNMNLTKRFKRGIKTLMPKLNHQGNKLSQV